MTSVGSSLAILFAKWGMITRKCFNKIRMNAKHWILCFETVGEIFGGNKKATKQLDSKMGGKWREIVIPPRHLSNAGTLEQRHLSTALESVQKAQVSLKRVFV